MTSRKRKGGKDEQLARDEATFRPVFEEVDIALDEQRDGVRDEAERRAETARRIQEMRRRYSFPKARG